MYDEEELIGLLQKAAQHFELKEDIQRWNSLSTVANDLVSMAFNRFSVEDKVSLEAYVVGVLDSLVRVNAIDKDEFCTLQYAVYGVLGVKSSIIRVTANS